MIINIIFTVLVILVLLYSFHIETKIYELDYNNQTDKLNLQKQELEKQCIETFDNLDKLNKENQDISNTRYLLFKKTLSYKLITNNNSYSVWEPEFIDDYFPVGQYISLDNKPPRNPAILVKSLAASSVDRPHNYEIVAANQDSYTIWKPVSKNSYVSLGHVFNKGFPSKHKFRCIPKKFTEESSINSKIINQQLDDSESNNKGYNLWNIYSNYCFLGSSLNNHEVPRDKVYKIKDNSLGVEKPMQIKHTKTYRKIWSYFNKVSKKHIVIWCPEAPDNYRTIGYIALAKNINPNENLETVVVHKDFCKPVLDYGEKSILNFKDTDTKISFWKPIAPKGYVAMSHVLVKGTEEPDANDLIYCISLEYTKEKSGCTKDIWNTIPHNNNKLSIWTNPNNFFYANNDYSKHDALELELNYKFIEDEEDIMDLSREIVANFKLNDDNTEVYDSDMKEQLFIKSISSRIGLNKRRIREVSFTDNSKINFKIVSRPAGSKELTVYESINQLRDIIEKDGLKINNSNDDNHIAVINSISVYEKNDKTEIPLDNSNYNSHFD